MKRRIVVRERCDAGVWNQHAEYRDAHGAWNRQRHRSADGDRTLSRARRNRAVGAASVAIAPIGEGLAVACVGEGIADAARS